MRKYFTSEDFITFLNLLKEDKLEKLYIEDVINDEIYEVPFLKKQFDSSTIILFGGHLGAIGLIQDTPLLSWKQLAEDIFEDLVSEDGNKIFINTD